MDYLLMNKSIPVLLFSCERDEFDEVVCREREWYTDLRPLGYYNLTDYLSRRQAPKHRKHIEELLTRYHCNDLEGFLNVTHALSLNDTYWVKPESSGILWEQVSLYRNDFNELVANAAFDGRFSDTVLSTTSPEFGTDGYFAKCWVREKNRIMLYKSGSTTFEIEPLSEFLSCQVARALHIEHVSYDLSFYHGRLISKCGLFTNEQTGLVKARDVLPGDERGTGAILRYFSAIGSEEQFRRMCVLDALILNTDRHFGNFGVLVDNDTQKILKMAPVYDNNRSLLFDMDASQLQDPEWCIGTCTPRIGNDFISVAKGMLNDGIRGDLTAMRSFAFSQHPSIRVGENRLEILSEVVRRQIEKILN